MGWLFLTNNNITGPLPTTNWATFPKLVSIDIAHNNINGDLPLDSMKSMPSLRYIKAHHNMLDSVTYSGGGFENLLELKFIYNRNLTSTFPAGFASIPNLLQLEMHDTNISGGPVPTGPWSNLDFLLISNENYMCVAQIWLDGKCLRGTIPESFRGLTELWWLFLTNNNITGPLPTTNWATFPKLVSIDIAHNNINGNLPLDSMKPMSSLRYIKAHHNMLDSVTYTGGGFEKLLELKFIYNRNLPSKFPAGFASIPNLQQLQMHDTNISGGPVP